MAASGLLSGIRVIEISHVMLAPVCGLLLSDMGAGHCQVGSIVILPSGP
jgi:crotonobetainyl-CoA:carnitine CoA-transferase CaiB-like acyl-CoA transferase